MVLLSGCAGETWEQWRRAGLPEAGTEEAPLIGDLWTGTWIAAMGVGVLVWGLILWSAFAYRRRDASLPPQTRYNLPIEFLYTIAPFTVIGALFFYTAQNQNEILDVSEEPDLTVGVIGQQWAWTFNYADEDVYDAGTTTDPTTLYLPVDQTVRFELNSPDVIHSFWVPQFYFKMDVIPGKENVFQVTPNREGTYTGRCAELCGAYHARMIFRVHVVSQNEFEDHIASLRDAGQTGQVEAPLRGSFSTEPLTENQPQVPSGKRSER
ncbi:MAG: cytochrome c oxidase subunit II [Jiangellaceae bacterium]|nr:cytochrome c oxidase subunit II [Jiangellaceae bacterium]